MTVLAETGLLGFSAWLALTGCFVLWLVRCAPLYGPSLAIIFLYGLLDIVFELPSLCFLFFTLVGLSAAPASRPAPLVRSASAILSAAGAAFSLVLFIAGDYHSQGMSVLQNPRVSRPELRAAADEFEKSRGLWPSPAADAAHGRVNLMRAAVERDPSYVRAAYADFNRAVKKSPATAGFRAGLGETLLAMGDTPLAAVQFKEAARLDPKGPYVEWVLELILGKATERTEDVRTPF